MENVVLVIHLIVAAAMIVVVLLQRSEGAGLVGPSGGGMMPVRGSANILTRATTVLATIFFVTSITLAILAGGHKGSTSIADKIATQEVPATTDAPVAPVTPAVPVPPVSQ